MKLLFICRASTEIGLGHLTRSRTLAAVAGRKHDVSFLVVGSEVARKLLSSSTFPFHILSDDKDIVKHVSKRFDVVIFDMMNLDTQVLEYLKTKSSLLVSISPIFDRMDSMDLFFSRTRYGLKKYDLTTVKQHTGLNYSIIQNSCVAIDSRLFRRNLVREHFPVAICMGGGDAANKTLLFLQSLRRCRVPATFWVLIGEGYNHSLDVLMKAIDRDKNHEIILAKTNVSMWHILNNCVLAILSGGVTTYEAAYAGLPTINMFESNDQFFLIKELIEAGVSINAGLISERNLKGLGRLVEGLYEDRNRLLEMHRKSRHLIDGKGSKRIIDVIEKEALAVSLRGRRTTAGLA
jgi:spore coat polysaccharide biosynthesis predicted glycosyltransferase SpsG